MAGRSKTSPTPEDFDEKIVDIDVSSEMQDAFLEYAYSVIYSRALPDARDGLKPVQRRILYTMDDMGLRPEKAHVKCGRIVGEVMGKLHPHGDGAIYDALVRMTQDFTLRLPLVDGHGNFGSLDDGPAAYRYTEARLDKSAMLMVDSLDENTVDFVANYDGQLQQPEVLPAAFPNLLVNGSSGIAVGMATNMAPHNLVEVIGAARHLLKHPNASLDDLMKFIPGPDLPTGGKIIGLDGIRDAYATGRGTFKVRASAKVENITARRKAIVFTELPYLVGPEKVIDKVKSIVQANKDKLPGISNITDLTDRESGTRLEVEIKGGFNPDAVLEKLYQLTPLEDSFGINNVTLVNGQPRTLGLKELLEVYVAHRLDVVRRRTEFRRGKAADRLHLVEGLLIAILDIDEVIAVIRTSDDTASARARLMEVFDLTQVQAEYILDMPLRRLTKYSRIELETERDELLAKIAALDEILGDDKILRRTVSDELAQVAKTFGTPRRTALLEAGAAPARAVAADLEITDDPCWVLMSSSGLIARTSSAESLMAPDPAMRSNHDVVTACVRATARGHVGVVTNQGRMIKIPVLDMPSLLITNAAPTVSAGAPLSEFVDLERKERIIGLASLQEDAVGVALGTKQGVVKRVTTDYPTNRDSWEIISLKDKDEVIGAVELTSENAMLTFVTSDAQLLAFEASKVRPQGRPAGGMAGISLAKGQNVVFFGATHNVDTAAVVTIAGSSDALEGTDAGSVKVTPFALYPTKGRATGGVRAHRFLKGEDKLLMAWVGDGPAIAAGSAGVPASLPKATDRRDGSGTPGERPVLAISGATSGVIAQE